MREEFYEELRNTSSSYYDRYKNCKILEDVETGDRILSTREIADIPDNPNDIYHRVQSNELNRLDLIAAKYYRNPLFWWVIAQANNIYDPLLPLDPGTIIRVPDIETLYGNNGILL